MTVSPLKMGQSNGTVTLVPKPRTMGFGTTRDEQNDKQGWTIWLEFGSKAVLGGLYLFYSVRGGGRV